MPVVEALRVLAAARGTEDVIVTNQGSARIWPVISQHPLDFAYNPSTMGGAVPFALGLALAQPRRGVIVVSGDGALLMSLGSLVSVVAAGAGNLTVVVLENGLYEVTGGQKTPAVSGRVDFAAVARAAGFRTAVRFDALDEWESQAAGLLRLVGPRFIHLCVQRTQREYLMAKSPPMEPQLARLRTALAQSPECLPKPRERG
jgi:thiamine pyrophosphate-dependent acetolactate synthase large subunit-like protein